MSNFRDELEQLINRFLKENGSDTPDWILADYLMDCLAVFDKAVCARAKWYGTPCGNGEAILKGEKPNE